jgi:hypothetical protein
MKTIIHKSFAGTFLITVLSATTAFAQQGYEFEVYGADVGHPGAMELELHTNYVPEGVRDAEEGTFSTHRAYRSSLELSGTVNSWLRASAYLTLNKRRDSDLSYVGNRVRLTAIAPQSWKLPFDLGLANELVFTQPGYAEYRSAYELTPILGKKIGSFSLALNPAFEIGLSGTDEHEIEFEPRGKLKYEFGDEAAVALEYYAGLGAISESYPLSAQRHQLFGRVEKEISNGFEIGFGVGRGLTRSSDKWVIATVFELEFPR